MPHGLKKTRRLRGSRTQGYGRVSQHRKSGGRGGKGKAGGKDHFWLQTVVYNPRRFLKIGFKPRGRDVKPPTKTINVGELEDLALRAPGAEATKSRRERLELDLTELGYGKLLGRGSITIPLIVKVPSRSSEAVEKVKAAGGDVKPE